MFGLSDDLYAALRRYVDDGRLIELTAAVAWQNCGAPFDHALGVEAQGFPEGGYCVLPEHPGP